MQLSIRDVARLLNVPERKVYRWLDDGGIPASRVNEEVRFNRSDLLEWATLNKLPISAEVLGEPSDELALSEALAAGGVRAGVSAPDACALAEAMLAALGVAGPAAETLREVLVARGARGLTPVGEGIAFPHVRMPVVADVPRPVVALFYLASPLDLGAPDGRPVDTLFFLLSPTARLHLRLLARLSAALRDPGLRALLARRAGADEVLAALRRLEGRA